MPNQHTHTREYWDLRNVLIYELRAKGLTYREIGTWFGITGEPVRQKCAKFDRRIRMAKPFEHRRKKLEKEFGYSWDVILQLHDLVQSYYKPRSYAS